jgi:hypothetical protein
MIKKIAIIGTIILIAIAATFISKYESIHTVYDSSSHIEEYNVKTNIEKFIYDENQNKFIWIISFKINGQKAVGTVQMVPPTLELQRVIQNNKYKIKAKVFLDKRSNQLIIYPRFVYTYFKQPYKPIRIKILEKRKGTRISW